MSNLYLCKSTYDREGTGDVIIDLDKVVLVAVALLSKGEDEFYAITLRYTAEDAAKISLVNENECRQTLREILYQMNRNEVYADIMSKDIQIKDLREICRTEDAMKNIRAAIMAD